MGNTTKPIKPGPHPHLWLWVTEVGTGDIGHCQQTRSLIRVLDAGGWVGKGRRNYTSPDAALAETEAGVSRWMKSELGMADAA